MSLALQNIEISCSAAVALALRYQLICASSRVIVSRDFSHSAPPQEAPKTLNQLYAIH